MKRTPRTRPSTEDGATNCGPRRSFHALRMAARPVMPWCPSSRGFSRCPPPPRMLRLRLRHIARLSASSSEDRRNGQRALMRALGLEPDQGRVGYPPKIGPVHRPMAAKTTGAGLPWAASVATRRNEACWSASACSFLLLSSRLFRRSSSSDAAHPRLAAEHVGQQCGGDVDDDGDEVRFGAGHRSRRCRGGSTCT